MRIVFVRASTAPSLRTRPLDGITAAIRGVPVTMSPTAVGCKSHHVSDSRGIRREMAERRFEHPMHTATTLLTPNGARTPSVRLPGGPCTLNGVPYNPCSTTANTNQRRVFSLERPKDGQLMAFVSDTDFGATQSYNGLLLSVERRAAKGVTVSGNYTWAHCVGDYADI